MKRIGLELDLRQTKSKAHAYFKFALRLWDISATTFQLFVKIKTKTYHKSDSFGAIVYDTNQ